MSAIGESKRRIYYLGLVLYELFAGVQAPPVSLYALAKLVEINENQSNSQVGYKHVQGRQTARKSWIVPCALRVSETNLNQ
jgi:hypothetical protein